jgi:hypothetical protein
MERQPKRGQPLHSPRSPVALAGRGKTRRVQSGRVQAEYPSRTRLPELGPEMQIGTTSLAAPTQRHCWFLPDQADGAGLQRAGLTHLQTRPRPGPLAECCPNCLNTNISHVLLILFTWAGYPSSGHLYHISGPSTHITHRRWSTQYQRWHRKTGRLPRPVSDTPGPSCCADRQQSFSAGQPPGYLVSSFLQPGPK